MDRKMKKRNRKAEGVLVWVVLNYKILLTPINQIDALTETKSSLWTSQ